MEWEKHLTNNDGLVCIGFRPETPSLRGLFVTRAVPAGTVLLTMPWSDVMNVPSALQYLRLLDDGGIGGVLPEEMGGADGVADVVTWCLKGGTNSDDDDDANLNAEIGRILLVCAILSSSSQQCNKEDPNTREIDCVRKWNEFVATLPSCEGSGEVEDNVLTWSDDTIRSLADSELMDYIASNRARLRRLYMALFVTPRRASRCSNDGEIVPSYEEWIWAHHMVHSRLFRLSQSNGDNNNNDNRSSSEDSCYSVAGVLVPFLDLANHAPVTQCTARLVLRCPHVHEHNSCIDMISIKDLSPGEEITWDYHSSGTNKHKNENNREVTMRDVLRIYGFIQPSCIHQTYIVCSKHQNKSYANEHEILLDINLTCENKHMRVNCTQNENGDLVIMIRNEHQTRSQNEDSVSKHLSIDDGFYEALDKFCTSMNEQNHVVEPSKESAAVTLCRLVLSRFQDAVVPNNGESDSTPAQRVANEYRTSNIMLLSNCLHELED